MTICFLFYFHHYLLLLFILNNNHSINISIMLITVFLFFLLFLTLMYLFLMSMSHFILFSYSSCLCFLITELSFRQDNIKFSIKWLSFRLTLFFKRDSINSRSLATFMIVIYDLTVFTDRFMCSGVIALYFRYSNVEFWIFFFFF